MAVSSGHEECNRRADQRCPSSYRYSTNDITAPTSCASSREIRQGRLSKEGTGDGASTHNQIRRYGGHWSPVSAPKSVLEQRPALRGDAARCAAADPEVATGQGRAHVHKRTRSG